MDGERGKLKDTDRAYLAGLFDGEGCVNSTFRSKGGYFSKREQKKKRYFWPAIQFDISGTHAHLSDIQRMIGLGGVYEDRRTKVWHFRITQPEQVLQMVNLILPYVMLKKKELLLMKRAALFISAHKKSSRWTDEEKDEFYKKFVLPSQKGKEQGRPTEFEKNFIREERSD